MSQPVSYDPQTTGHRADAADVPETVIDPPSGWEALNLRELWEYRNLLVVLAWRDVKVHYKQTVFGPLWAVLKPLLMMAIFTVFLVGMGGGGATAGGQPYPLFVYAGLLPWTYFSAAVTSAGNSLAGAESLICKIYFPRLVVPAATMLANLIDLAIGFVGLVLLLAYYGTWPSPQLLLVLPLTALLTVAGLGAGTLAAAVNVRYRDMRYMIPFAMQFWMFATPAIYNQSAAAGGSGAVQLLGRFNPMTGLVMAFRAAILGGPVPWPDLGVSVLFVVASAVVGFYYFRRVEGTFADII